MEVEETANSDVLLKALEALKKASKEVVTHGFVDRSTAADADGSPGFFSPHLRALLELEALADDLAGDPQLSTLFQLLSQLKSLAFSKEDCDGGLLGTLMKLRRSKRWREISRVAGLIGTEFQSWLDRESTARLVAALRRPPETTHDEDEREALLGELEARVSQGFDRGIQEVLLRAGAFGAVESALADVAAPKRVRERAAAAALALVRFNKAVFAGPVLMGPTVDELIVGMPASPAALAALRGLISAIRSPLVDELLSRGHIPRLVTLLSATKSTSNTTNGSGAVLSLAPVEVRVLALECWLEMGYYGRKEAIDAMVAGGLVERLMELQRSELGGTLIDMEEGDGSSKNGVEAGRLAAAKDATGGGWWWGEEKERRVMAARPFASCVSRWAIQLEVGEGLRQREKREIKREIVRRVGAGAASGLEAEAATVLAEVLWGSTPWT